MTGAPSLVAAIGAAAAAVAASASPVLAFVPPPPPPSTSSSSSLTCGPFGTTGAAAVAAAAGRVGGGGRSLPVLSVWGFGGGGGGGDVRSSDDDDEAGLLSSLPRGISPFEKSLSKSIDVQSDFRTRAKAAVDAAISSSGGGSSSLLEIEFPPLIGGYESKSQFDDFDNVQELDRNKDWTMQFAPLFLGRNDDIQRYGDGKTWLIFPDLKECEIARKEWAGGRYRTATFTTIQAATDHLCGDGSFDAPWGSALVSGVSRIVGSKDGDAGLLGDETALDELVDGKNSPASLALVIQPGNGGPVEDWINLEKVYEGSPETTTMVVINGALDKVRGGYYPAVFFPKLAATVERFYNRFESVFYLKPISDKGVYGWLYRVYPEPWQVVLQTPKENNRGELEVVDTVVYMSKERPSYNEAVAKLVAGAAKKAQI